MKAQDVARRISGAVAGTVFAQVKTYQAPITNPSPLHLHYLPLVFLSPTSPLPFYSPSLSQSPSLLSVCLPFAIAESKRTKGFLPSSSALDNPSILSKLMNNDTIRPTGVSNESLNNFDEDDSGIFHYLLDESLKDASDRLLRIRASYVPQY